MGFQTRGAQVRRFFAAQTNGASLPGVARASRRPFLALLGLAAGALPFGDRSGLPVAHARGRVHVVVYMAAWCRACQQHMRGLDRLGIRYRAVDIEKDPGPYEPIRQRLGRSAIPVTIVKRGTAQRWVIGNDSAGVERAVRDLGD